jgi:flagellar basal-body rod modification protein FlgD
MLNSSQNPNPVASPIMAVNSGKNGLSANPQTMHANAAEAKPGTAKSADSKSSPAEAQDRFLKLLVTQMKNQDPLNPMDNAQVTSQMAQLSTVSGIDKLNATLNALSSSMTATQSMQAAVMIGHVVMAPGNKMELKNGKSAAALDLAQSADNVTVQIKDAAGNVIRNMNLGSQPGGVLPIQWDGLNDANATVADGNYQFAASAQLGDKKSSISGLSYGLVNGVVQKAEGASLTVEGLGEVSMDAVKKIL